MGRGSWVLGHLLTVLAVYPKQAVIRAEFPHLKRRQILRPAPTSLRLAAFVLATVFLAPTASSQTSLAPQSPSGQSVTPVFEGWYRNADGTYSISFGYLNRNGAEQMQVPIGDGNFIAPGLPNQGQPTAFAARRQWGVFAVVVPADFGTKSVVWTLKDRGQTFAIPGSLKPDWEIDAIQGEASTDNTPPMLRFSSTGPEGRGPRGVTVGPLRATVGKAIELTVDAVDDGKTKAPVDLTWFAHQGPGDVAFGTVTNRLTPTGGTGRTTATFARAGEYVIRVRANDSNVMTAGHAQCCWTNSFVKVVVTP